MPQEEYQRRRRALCVEHGISPVQESLLWTAAHLEGNSTFSRLADDAHALAETAFSLPDYQAAVTECLDKKWLRILTQADCDQDKRRWRQKPAHGIWDAEYVTETEYQPGRIDFTEEGARAYYSLAAAKDRLVRRKPYEGTLCYTWHPPGMVRIWGVYPEDAAAELHEIQQMHPERDAWMGWNFTDASQITHIEGQYEIAGWWLTRFVRIAPGYYADVHYAPHMEECIG